MGILPGKGKTKEQKMREQRAEKDSFQVSKAEAQQLAKDQDEKDQARSQLLNPEEDKKKLKELLLNVKPVEVPQYLHFCNNCGTAFQQKPDEKCPECNKGNGFTEKQGSNSKIKWVDRSEDELLNNNGFNKIVWSEVQPAISGTVAGGYLKSNEISKLNYSTLSTITMQLALYPWKYGVDNPSDMQQIGDIIRPMLIAHTSKARGGRGLESTEKTTMQKITRTLTGPDDEEDTGLF